MSSIKPLISVIITLYNYENFISHCLKSVLNQNYSNLEIVVVDDASTDSSYKRAKAFEGENVRVIRFNKNRGYSAAKNEGIRESNGEYLVMLDADDMLMKKSIHRRMKALMENDVDFVHANAVVVKNNCTLQD